MQVELLVKIGFFIYDLQNQIKTLHNQQKFSEIFTVYHSQALSQNQFNQLIKSNHNSICSD